MSDNFTASPGTGLTMGADDVGGVKYPRVKMVFGPSGTAHDVSSSAPLPVTSGVGDTESATPVGIVWPAAALYQELDSVTTLTHATIGRLRSTRRRAMMVAADCSRCDLEGNQDDITRLDGQALDPGDFSISDDAEHTYLIPLCIAGWRRLTIQLTQTDVRFDQPATWKLYAANPPGTIKVLLASGEIPAAVCAFGIGHGAVGVGGQAGGATVADGDWYDVQALQSGLDYVCLTLQCDSTPTVCVFHILVVRSS